jgi:hypothetical protein
MRDQFFALLFGNPIAPDAGHKCGSSASNLTRRAMIVARSNARAAKTS